MMFILLDKNPVEAANYLIEKTNKNFAFKQLIELGQLLAGITHNVYKEVKQGKEIKSWIKKNMRFTLLFYKTLLGWSFYNIKMKKETYEKMRKIYDLSVTFAEELKNYKLPITAIFRYLKGYECEIPTNTELPIEECIAQYKKYIEWKKEKNVKGY